MIPKNMHAQTMLLSSQQASGQALSNMCAWSHAAESRTHLAIHAAAYEGIPSRAP